MSGEYPSRRRRTHPRITATLVGLLAAAVILLVALVVRDSRQSVATCTRADQTVTFIGDSYTNGTAKDSGEQARFPALLKKQLGTKVQVLGFNGSGYVARGPKPYNVTFPEAANRVQPNATTVVIFGSRNDTAGYDQINKAVGTTIDNVRRRAPGAQILVIGPPWINNKPNDQIQLNRNAVRDAANNKRVDFVDPLQLGWFGDPNQIKDGKSTLIADDHIHPTDAGHAYLAQKMRPLIAPTLCQEQP